MRKHILSRRAAFFDVDNTLTTVVSVFRFLACHYSTRGLPAAAFDDAMEQLRRLKASGAGREQANVAYLALYAGQRAEDLAAQGERWFAAETERGGFFHPPVLAAFRRHAAVGNLTVLVSGSISACLDPIARHLGADEVLCSLPHQRDGLLTDLPGVAMVGERKASAVRELAERRGISLADSYAYGDHISDLPLLTAVGHPVVVGDDPALAAHAARANWPRIPGASDGSVTASSGVGNQ